MPAPDFSKIDTLGQALAQAAMRGVIRLCPEVRTATTAQLETVCVAMRATSSKVVAQLLDDAKAVPALAEAAFVTAALTMAQAGVDAFREQRAA